MHAYIHTWGQIHCMTFLKIWRNLSHMLQGLRKKYIWKFGKSVQETNMPWFHMLFDKGCYKQMAVKYYTWGACGVGGCNGRSDSCSHSYNHSHSNGSHWWQWGELKPIIKLLATLQPVTLYIVVYLKVILNYVVLTCQLGCQWSYTVSIQQQQQLQQQQAFYDRNNTVTPTPDSILSTFLWLL